MTSGWNDDGETGGTQIPYNLWPFTLPQHYWNNFKILLIFWLYIPLLSPASLFQPLLPNPAPLQTDDITFMVRGHKQSSSLEWFSFECRKTKTKVITLANHIGHRQYIEPIKTRSNYMWLTQSAGKSCERVTIGFGFTSDWMKRWRESFKPIASCRKCKTNYFSTLKWKPL